MTQVSANTSKMIARAISGFEKDGHTLTQAAEMLYADGIRFGMLKGNAPSEQDTTLRNVIKQDIASGFTKDEQALYFADKKIAKDFDDTLKTARKAVQDKISQYYKRLCAAMPDAETATSEPKTPKTDAEKIRVMLDTIKKIAQGEPDGSMADLVAFNKLIDTAITATFLKSSPNI
jgi:hypothetical protein